MWSVWVAGCTSVPPEPAEPVVVDDVRLFVPGVVATRDLPAGTVIGADDVAVGGVPEFAPSPVTDPGPLVGRTVREPILAGEPFRVERTVSGTGWAALATAGVAEVSRFAAPELGPGCLVELVELGDLGRRPRLAVPDPVPVLGTTEDAVVVDTAARWDGPVALVVVQRPEEENPASPVFEAPERPGRKVAVARHPLLAGAFVRSEDLDEVGGVGLEGLDLPEVWARTPHQRILAGEVVRPERIATETTGICTKIPDGMRGVSVPVVPGTARADWVDQPIWIRLRGNEVRDLYVLQVDRDLVTVAAGPDLARAIAAAVLSSGEAFEAGR